MRYRAIKYNADGSLDEVAVTVKGDMQDFTFTSPEWEYERIEEPAQTDVERAAEEQGYVWARDIGAFKAGAAWQASRTRGSSETAET